MWERLDFAVARDEVRETKVTGSWRKTSSKGRPCFCVNIGATAARALTWPAKARVAIEIDRAGERLRMFPAEDGQRALKVGSGKNNAATMSVDIPLPWARQDQKVRPERLAHEITDLVLVVTLPEWARRPAAKGHGAGGAEAGAEPAVRPAGATPADSSPPPIAAEAGVAPGTAPNDPPAGGEPPRKWSDERKAKLREMWLARRQSDEIAAALNALPGPEVRKNEVSAYAIAGLKLPTKAQLEQEAAKAAAKLVASPPPPVPAPPPAVAEPAAPTRADREAQARALLAEGRAESYVAAITGLPLQDVRVMVEQSAAQADAALAARQDKARRLLAKGLEPEAVRLQTRLELREILRLQAELREAARGRAA